MALRVSLSIVLAHVRVVGGDEANDALLALVAHVDTDQHGLVGDLLAEVHAPEITSEFGVDLPDNIEIDTVIISVDGLAGNELRDNGVVRVNFIFNGGVESLLSQGVRDDDKEELNDWLLRLLLRRDWALLSASGLDLDVIPEVGVNSVLEVLD